MFYLRLSLILLCNLLYLSLHRSGKQLSCQICSFTFGFFKTTASLSCNSHTLKFILLKCTVFSIFMESCIHHHYIFNSHIFIIPKGNTVLISITPIPPSPQPLKTTSYLSVSMDLPILDVIEMESYNIWPFVTGFFH